MSDPETTALTVGLASVALPVVKPFVGEIARQAQDFIAAVTEHHGENTGPYSATRSAKASTADKQ
jgi:hypothetical protein